MKGILELAKQLTLKGVDTIKAKYEAFDGAAQKKADEVRASRTSKQEEVKQ